MRGRWTVVVLAGALALGATGCGRGDATGGGATSGAGGAAASPGISRTEVEIGGSYPFSGPAAAYGTIAAGAKAAFAQVNAQGGVNGRRIRFVALDDGYDPQRALQNAQRLIQQEKVFALFNTLGTANTLATWTYVNQQKVPQVYVSTAASQFGQTGNGHPWTIGWLPTYRFEGRTYASYLRRVKPQARVAVLYQNDDFGKELLRGFQDGIVDSGVRIADAESYEVTDPSVASQVSKLAATKADAFLSITTPKAAAQSIAAVAQSGWRPIQFLYNGSASPQLVFKPVGLKAATGIISSTMLKDPADPRWARDAGVRAYEAAMRRYQPRADPANFFTEYGYATAQTLVQALRSMRQPTRDALMAAVRSMDVTLPTLLPGVRVQTSPADGYPVQALQLQRFDGQRWRPVGALVHEAG
jgi:branched-chain amino acid transport system substrate-binding protein